MRKCYDFEKKKCILILMGLHIFNFSEKKNFLECHLSVYTHIWICALLMPEQIDKFYSYSIFKSLSFIGQCPVNMSILAPEIRVLQMGPKLQIFYFLENGSDFD
jgi:hypothetical protein